MKSERRGKPSPSLFSTCLHALGMLLEFICTLLYRELFKRNTLKPLTEIIDEPRVELQRRLLRQWARRKSRESTYIQVAVGTSGRSAVYLAADYMQGGFLFTSVASCLQWPGTQNGHWSAAASFYVCMLLAFVTIVMGSQQLLVLPTERPQDTDEDFETATAMDSKDRFDRELRDSDKRQLQAVVRRLCDTSHKGRPNPFLVFALQAPIMLLTLSVMAFLVGLCSVVFAPLRHQLGWNDNAKIRIAIRNLINSMPT